MKLIGLTGGIATGKSTVTLYVQAQQVPVIDCDVLARNILQPGHPVYAQVAKHFPTCVSNTQGLDRKALGKLIFSSPSARKTLNQLTHGSIRRQLLVQVLCHWLKGTSLLLIDAPLLIEAGLDKWMSEVVVVYCSQELQRVRLMQRDGCTEEEAEQRIAAQFSMTEKLKKATYVLENNHDLPFLYQQVDKMLQSFRPSKIHVYFWWSLPWCLFLLITVSILRWSMYDATDSSHLKVKVHLNNRKYF